MTARVILHLPGHVHDGFRGMRIYGIHAAIERLVTRRGGTVLIAPRPPEYLEPHRRDDDGDLHIIENGRLRGPGMLNAALAYLDGFYHLDPEGVLADSSLRHRSFDPADVDGPAAEAFLDLLRQRLVQPRRSRYGQTQARRELPQGAIAVFLQGPKPERMGQAHLTTEAMLRAVWQGAGDRPVVVKPHPLKPELGARQIAMARAEGAHLIETRANVHDILAAAAVSVSINSATAFEGFLHGTPAILCGRTDFPACFETLRDPAGFPAALSRALGAQPPYAKPLFWYFVRHCLDLAAPDLETRLWQRFAEVGFPPDRLGLSD